MHWSPCHMPTRFPQNEVMTKHQKHRVWHIGQQQETWVCTQLQDLGAGVLDGGSKPKILSRISQTTATITNLKTITVISSKIRPNLSYGNINIPIGLWATDLDSRSRKENQCLWSEVLLQKASLTKNILLQTRQQKEKWRPPLRHTSASWPEWENQTKIVWTCHPFTKTILQGAVQSERREADKGRDGTITA